MKPLRRHKHGLHSSGSPRTAPVRGELGNWQTLKDRQEADALRVRQGKPLTKRQREAREAALKMGKLSTGKASVLAAVVPDHPDQPKIEILFTLKLDPYSGKWRTLIRKTQPDGEVKRYWSRPMTLYELEKLAKREADDRVLKAYRERTTAPKTVGISGIDLQRAMELGVFKKVPASSLSLTEGRQRAAELIKARHELAKVQKEQEMDDLFDELGLNQPLQVPTNNSKED
jgi:hypothetical protein